MSDELVHIEVMRYRDAEGNPTCAAGFNDGRVCRFYGTRKLGAVEVCMLQSADLLRRLDLPDLLRSGGGSGSLIPADGCPVWVQR